VRRVRSPEFGGAFRERGSRSQRKSTRVDPFFGGFLFLFSLPLGSSPVPRSARAHAGARRDLSLWGRICPSETPGTVSSRWNRRRARYRRHHRRGGVVSDVRGVFDISTKPSSIVQRSDRSRICTEHQSVNSRKVIRRAFSRSAGTGTPMVTVQGGTHPGVVECAIHLVSMRLRRPS
jgi:hypothetical protein